MSSNDPLIQQLNRLKSYNAFKYILPNAELHELQAVDLLRCLAVKRAILRYPTGTGKTYVASGWITALKNRYPMKKTLVFVKKTQMNQFVKDVKRLTGLKCVKSDATKESISALIRTDLGQVDVIVLTHHCLGNVYAMRYVNLILDKISNVVVDEAHELAMFESNTYGFMLFSMLRNFSFALMLTATPMTTKCSQVSHLIKMTNRGKVDKLSDFSKNLNENPSCIKELDGLIINRTREEFGCELTYHTYPLIIDPLPYQKDGGTTDILFDTTKGRGAHNSTRKLIEVIQSRVTEKGIVFVNYHKTREWVCEELDKAGISYGCINGRTTQQGINDKIQKQFNDGEFDVLITSLTTSLNLDCDYIFMYEYTTDMQQLLGRGCRGLKDKILSIYVLFVRDTGEIEYFNDKIYSKSLKISMMFGDEFAKIMKKCLRE